MLQTFLRPATIADIDALAQFAVHSYVETFVDELGFIYPPDDLHAFLDETRSSNAFARYMANPTYDVRLLADGDGIAAYTLTGAPSLMHPDVRDDHKEIMHFYLRRDLQGSSMAAAALAELLRDLDPDGNRPIWLSVWEGNLRAQRFYARNGFRKVGEHPFPVGRQQYLILTWRRG
jgi:RimJ/RimL family protein N-acetyltransferase